MRRPSARKSTDRLIATSLRAAVAAPSIHNTQPWRFRIRDGGFDVLADPDRGLGVIDPDRRAMYVSIGAAVFNLRLALAAAGRTSRQLPFAPDSDRAARIEPGPPRVPSPGIEALATAVFRRRTNRSPYLHVAVPAATIDEMRAAATAATVGAELTLLDPIHRDAVLGLTWTADTRQRTDPAYRQELRAWTSGDSYRRDGIPAPLHGPRNTTSALPVRDFGLATPPADRVTARFEDHPQLVMLSSTGDDRDTWLRTGQALQRVLLVATIHGISAQPMTQALEVPDLRRMISGPVPGWYPQMILRIGYGKPVAISPRRPIPTVLAHAHDR